MKKSEFKNFKVELSETTKHNPAKRTINITTKDEYTAMELILQQFGRSKVKIDKIEEVKEGE